MKSYGNAVHATAGLGSQPRVYQVPTGWFLQALPALTRSLRLLFGSSPALTQLKPSQRSKSNRDDGLEKGVMGPYKPRWCEVLKLRGRGGMESMGWEAWEVLVAVAHPCTAKAPTTTAQHLHKQRQTQSTAQLSSTSAPFCPGLNTRIDQASARITTGCVPKLAAMLQLHNSHNLH